MRTLVHYLVCLMIAVDAAAAAQSAYPTKPIRLVVASSPGGPNELLARAIIPGWTEALGRTVVIDARAGAAGVIGTDLAAKAAPDGYTLLLGFQGPLAIAPSLTGTPYDALKDFAPVTLVAGAPFVLVVNPGVPAKTLIDLVALARARPGRLNFASGGVGIGSHLQMELLMQVAGISMVHVPYKGGGPALTALAGSEVECAFAGVAAVLPHMKAERIRALAIGTEKRLAAVANVPTFVESGYRINPTSWYGVLAPRATPPSIVALLHENLVRVVDAPGMRSKLVDMGFEVNVSTPDEFSTRLREESATWRKVIEVAGLKGKG